MSGPIVFVAGRNPTEELGGGHSAYVRAHARAALAAGFTPQVFCVGPWAGVFDSEYGVIHQADAGVRPARQMFIRHHGRALVRAVEEFLSSAAEPTALHGFGVWGAAAVTVAQRFARRGARVGTVVSSYTTYEAENRSKAEAAARPGQGLRHRLRFTGELAWVRGVVNAHERRAYEGADLVLCNYRNVRELLLARYDVAERLRVVPYTAESAYLPLRPLDELERPPALDALGPAGAPLLVAVSRADPRKGLDVLVRAISLLREQGVAVRACVVGPGPLLGDHRRLVRQLGLDGCVAFVGEVPDPEPYLRHAEVFVLPSLAEQSGSLAVIEALRAGVAVVASACDGLLEDLADGEDALLVEPGSARVLADALRRVLTEGPLRARLARQGRVRYDDRFGPERLRDSLGGIYSELGLEAVAVDG